ncbi:MAG: hypothetical protein KatS3mg115_1245 [Candidatus Poribacteria bacterium]|nr:MAG: hypothetical protein KatS3mg115_1245 [Candidatus Poribacteria bacterium]
MFKAWILPLPPTNRLRRFVRCRFIGVSLLAEIEERRPQGVEEPTVRVEVAYEFSAPNRQSLERWLAAQRLPVLQIEEIEPAPLVAQTV